MLLVEVLASIMGLAITVMTLSQVSLKAFSSVAACQTDVKALFDSFSLSSEPKPTSKQATTVRPWSRTSHVILRVSPARPNELKLETHAGWYRKVAESRGRKYLNPYDLGWRDNLGEFFNVGGARDGK